MDVKTNLRKMNTARTIAAITSAVLNVAIIAGVILFLLFPATELLYDAGKYADGYRYYGWQLAFMGSGYPPVEFLAMFEDTANIAGDYVPGVQDFAMNMTIVLAIVLPLVATIVCAAVSTKMKNFGKAVCEIVIAATLIYAGIVFIAIAPISATTAMGVRQGIDFAGTILGPAMKAQTYYTMLFPVLLGIVSIIIALLKAGNGAFLLFQKAYARKNLI